MNRICATILLLVYFTVSSGFVINLHYCMGKAAGMELGATSRKDCGKCGMPVGKKAGCCEDELKVVKLQQDQSVATFAVYHFSAVAILLQPQLQPLSIPAVSVTDFLTPKAHAPPLISAPPIYLSNRVFRI